ncbi:DUF4190 domain-containing protein [Nocardioides sp. AE5]|uniref:DUF4190 domain-containing protein n=1 Tax=Nocardioides sp. AE5 TaxID=2962573 RepID=UPI0028813D8F|nr:DUF4190 domain-containing protein [Nocardioides sp. AE5]MDT0200739.1 DUF4190 domain-containing protein [Nocardioides sp. AE5]
MSHDEPTRQHQPGYGPGAPPYGAPQGFYPGYGYTGYAYLPPPAHPSAGTAMGLGLTGLVGGMLCGFLFVVAPFAWATGARVVREIDAEPGRWSGRDSAHAGMVMGIVGTVLLLLAVLAVIAVIVLAITMPELFEE